MSVNTSLRLKSTSKNKLRCRKNKPNNTFLEEILHFPFDNSKIDKNDKNE